MISAIEQRVQLERDGFALFDEVFDRDEIGAIDAVSQNVLNGQDDQHFEAQRSTGSMVSVVEHEVFVDVITSVKIRRIFADLGFDDPRFSSGYLIAKRGQSPPLFWHQDWYCWSDQNSYTDQIQQVFVMVYLVDTERANGCLRVVPGSHRRRTEIHDLLPEAHSDELRRMSDPHHLAYADYASAIDVPSRVGDVIVGDARLIHGAYGNTSGRPRPLLTLWYHPDFTRLPEPVQAAIAEHKLPTDWRSVALDRLRLMWASYDGAAAPSPKNRKPDHRLTHDAS